jgi:hypothetical protein
MSMDGQIGTLVSGGSVVIDFGQAVAQLSNLQVGFTNAVYTIGGAASLLPSGTFASGRNLPPPTCVGNGCLAVNGGSFAGFLVGAGGTGVGLGYSIDVSSLQANFIRGVVGYGRLP